jgi:hypothetical protein
MSQRKATICLTGTSPFLLLSGGALGENGAAVQGDLTQEQAEEIKAAWEGYAPVEAGQGKRLSLAVQRRRAAQRGESVEAVTPPPSPRWPDDPEEERLHGPTVERRIP